MFFSSISPASVVGTSQHRTAPPLGATESRCGSECSILTCSKLPPSTYDRSVLNPARPTRWLGTLCCGAQCWHVPGAIRQARFSVAARICGGKAISYPDDIQNRAGLSSGSRRYCPASRPPEHLHDQPTVNKPSQPVAGVPKDHQNRARTVRRVASYPRSCCSPTGRHDMHKTTLDRRFDAAALVAASTSLVSATPRPLSRNQFRSRAPRAGPTYTSRRTVAGKFLDLSRRPLSQPRGVDVEDQLDHARTSWPGNQISRTCSTSRVDQPI